jgi:hypothetical protein
MGLKGNLRFLVIRPIRDSTKAVKLLVVISDAPDSRVIDVAERFDCPWTWVALDGLYLDIQAIDTLGSFLDRVYPEDSADAKMPGGMGRCAQEQFLPEGLPLILRVRSSNSGPLGG